MVEEEKVDAAVVGGREAEPRLKEALDAIARLVSR
jgi:hypothetical protein